MELNTNSSLPVLSQFLFLQYVVNLVLVTLVLNTFIRDYLVLKLLFCKCCFSKLCILQHKFHQPMGWCLWCKQFYMQPPYLPTLLEIYDICLYKIMLTTNLMINSMLSMIQKMPRTTNSFIQRISCVCFLTLLALPSPDNNVKVLSSLCYPS